MPPVLIFKQLSTFQSLLDISAHIVARVGLFMTRHVNYITSEGCGLKGQSHFQDSNIIKTVGW